MRSFRAQLLEAIMGIVVVTTIVSLLIAQRQHSDSHKAVVDDLFRQQLSSFQQEQETRLDFAAQEAQALAGSVRLFAALEANDPEVYKIAVDELRVGDFTFFRLLNARGEVIAPPRDGRAGLSEIPELQAQLIPANAREPSTTRIELGFVRVQQENDVQIMRIMATPIANFGAKVGTLILGQRLNSFGFERGGEATQHLQSGFWLDGNLMGGNFAFPVRMALAKALEGKSAPETGKGEFQATGSTYRYERFLLNDGSSYSPAFLISAFSMAEFEAQQRLLMQRIVLTGIAALALAWVAGRALTKQLVQPVRNLVSATREIGKGNYAIKLPPSPTREMNELAESFREMAAGLALKDRYRSVLNQVTDPQVAEELIAGRVSLGGEVREVTIIFCDIRGYTAMTVGRDPAEVIEILNSHLGAMTRVVQAHQGVISQFVGDALFIFFGAPKSYDDDARRAAHCAWAMMLERQRMNQQPMEPLEIGIGIASGRVVAGCIGGETRNDYVVVGERVNLAARLCSAAVAGEILMDEETRARVGDAVTSESLPPMELKGFSQPVPVFRIVFVANSMP
jgi:class 3 adenylate cyclase